MACQRIRICGNGFRCPLRHNFAPPVAAVRPQVDDIIGCFYDIKIMLDDNHRIARVDKFLKHIDQPVHIRGVQARRGFVEKINGLARGAF